MSAIKCVFGWLSECVCSGIAWQIKAGEDDKYLEVVITMVWSRFATFSLPQVFSPRCFSPPLVKKNKKKKKPTQALRNFPISVALLSHTHQKKDVVPQVCCYILPV